MAVVSPPPGPTVTPTSYFSQFQQPTYQQAYGQPVYQPPPAVPAPMYQPPPPPQPVQVVRQQAPVPARVATPAQVSQPSAPFSQEWYGRVQDPMMYVITTAAPPMRPQFEGEMFFERVAKNMFLSALEAVAGQAFLAVRQMFLPPEPPRPVSQVTGEVLNVTP